MQIFSESRAGMKHFLEKVAGHDEKLIQGFSQEELTRSTG